MRFEQESESPVLGAVLVAPLVTPIIALPALAWFSNLGTSDGYYMIAIPFILAFAVAFGYLGMLLVCLPLFGLLRKTRLLSAPLLCLLTSVIGTILWAWSQADPKQPLVNSVVVGFLCSFGVCAVFCYLADVGMRRKHVPAE